MKFTPEQLERLSKMSDEERAHDHAFRLYEEHTQEYNVKYNGYLYAIREDRALAAYTAEQEAKTGAIETINFIKSVEGGYVGYPVNCRQVTVQAEDIEGLKVEARKSIEYYLRFYKAMLENDFNMKEFSNIDDWLKGKSSLPKDEPTRKTGGMIGDSILEFTERFKDSPKEKEPTLADIKGTFVCSNCGKSFSSIQATNDHLSKEHPVLKEDVTLTDQEAQDWIDKNFPEGSKNNANVDVIACERYAALEALKWARDRFEGKR